MRSFALIFVIVSAFTILANLGYLKFEELRGENVAAASFQLFFYLYMIATGLIAASPFSRISILRNLAQGLTGILEDLYLGFSGGLVGWSFGTLVNVILMRKFEIVPFGIFITAYMLLFSLMPVWYKEKITAEVLEIVSSIFRNHRYTWALRVSGVAFVISGSYGLYRFFSV